MQPLYANTTNEQATKDARGTFAAVPDIAAMAELARFLDEERSRYLDRLHERMQVMAQLLAAMRDGDRTGVQQLRTLVHKTRGSAPSFGFIEIGQLAATWEEHMMAWVAAGEQAACPLDAFDAYLVDMQSLSRLP